MPSNALKLPKLIIHFSYKKEVVCMYSECVLVLLLVVFNREVKCADSLCFT